MAHKSYSNDTNYSQRVLKQMTGLHLVAYFGLREVMLALFKYGHDPDTKDSYGQTPLSYAARFVFLDDISPDS